MGRTQVRPGPGRRLAPMTAALTVIALAAWVGLIPDTDLPASPAPWVWPFLLLAFTVAESTQLHLELRRHAVSLSLSEFPLVLGLFLVDPFVLLLTRLGGALLVALWRRAPAYKTAFNSALFSTEVGLAVLLFDAVRGDEATGPRSWTAAYVALLVVSLVTGALLLAAVVRLQGALDRADVVLWFAPLVVGALLGSTAALLALIVAGADLRAVPVMLLLVVLLLGGYRAYGRLLRRHETLELLHAFTSEMSASGDAHELLSQALRHTRGLLSADCAQIVLLASELAPGRALQQRGADEDEHVDVETGSMVAAVLAGSGPLLLERGTQAARKAAWLDRAGLRDAMVVPVTGTGGAAGALVVGERLGETPSFGPADLQLLEMVAAHLEVALRSSDLVARLREEATHDALTGLPNRKLFHERLTAAVEHRRPGQSFAVLLMDLDSFKDVNDTLGHDSGDQMLVEVARRLEAAVPPHVTVARLGGDEFALLVPVSDDPDDGRLVAELLHRALRAPFHVCDVELEIRASLGVALCPEHGDDTSVLLRHADVAMYAAKAAQVPVQLYGPEIDRSSPRRLALVNDLRGAVESGALTCHYQPKVRVSDSSVTGVEALVRWHHPTLGNVGPDTFIPMAEHSGLIVPLTSLVLRTALQDCASWIALGHDLDVAVNVSPRALLAPDFVQEVTGVLADTGLPARRLTLEVTESSVMHDPRRAKAVLTSLHDLGVQLSVDDFGTGYSSLAYLQQLPVDEVKIDKSFVSDLATDSSDVAIVRAIVDLGHNLSLRVVAEGVEDARSLAVLQDLRCDTAQGYLVSRPLPQDRLLAWLAQPATRVGRVGPEPGQGPRLVALG